jgi:hypothetical protein
MKCQCLYRVLAALALGTPLLAQTVTLPGGVTTTPIVLEQSYTTGMVGFTVNQTARLNVLNLNSVPVLYPTATTSTTTTTSTANCTVELQFYDNKGALVQQFVVPNFAPGAATSFDLPRTGVTSETAARAEIRGVVVVNPPTAVASPAAEGYCTVFTTLEVFDSTTGSTVSSTSDTRSMGALSLTGILAGIK